MRENIVMLAIFIALIILFNSYFINNFDDFDRDCELEKHQCLMVIDSANY